MIFGSAPPLPLRRRDVFRSRGRPPVPGPRGPAGAVRPEADVWCAGVLLYFLLSGRRPFAGPTDEALFNSILAQDPDFSAHPWP